SSNANMTVTEHIRVHAEAHRIRHGIYRDFPTEYHDSLGNRFHVDFKVLGATRDGATESWHTQQHDNGVRVYLGSRNVVLHAADYTYTLTYQVSREIGFFADHDELYWNVTGIGWIFPIYHSGATIRLPVRVGSGKLKAFGYTGVAGSHEHALKVQLLDDGASYASTRALSAGEGLSVVLEFPKGIITEPSTWQKLHWLLRDNRSLLIGLVGLGLLWLYYVWAWRRYGRDPAAGVRIPLYEPPDGDSACALRYVRRMGWDKTCFTAGVLGLAAKGALTIERDNDKTYTLVRKAGASDLTSDEQKLYQALFAGGDVLLLKNSQYQRLQAARDKLKKQLSLAYEKKYFFTHRSKLIPGFIISLVALSTILSTGNYNPAAWFMVAWLSLWSVGTAALAAAAWRGTHDAHGAWAKIGSLFGWLMAVVFLVVELAVLGLLGVMIGFLNLLIFIALIGTNIAFYQWMKAPTQDGARLLDKIEGFRWYLGVAEKQELDSRYKPESRPELFARYLPYAVALDLGNAWAQRFAEALTAQQLQQAQPTWYRGSGITGFVTGANLASFSSDLSGSLTGAISSASTAPGSSSGGGFGGGGGSGGGGGGGGGGGW
ncbi:MAG TPA: DUF2207 domain-containing protein, partial [Hyphomicrobiales bacterium]|nr:DUF2207 domain-containing protein [Hyphomicrobiales bacterium]